MIRLLGAIDQVGIGIDIEENQRFIKLRDDKVFLKKIFTASEVKYCLSKSKAEQHLAARFAAKEASIKALNQLGLKKIIYRDVEVVSMGGNSPIIKIKGHDNLSIKVSLSHSNIESVAVVIIMKN